MREQPKSPQQNAPNCSKHLDSLKPTSIFIIITIIVIYALGIQSQEAYESFANNPQQVFPPNYKIWLLLTSLFSEQSFFIMLIILVNYFKFLSKLERRTSSIWLLCTYISLGIILQLCFTGLWWLLSLDQKKTLVCFGGATSIWFNLMFKYCYFNRKNKFKICCTDLKMDKLFYPFIMLAIITLISFRIKLDAVIGLLFAFVECFACKGSMICQKCWCFGVIDRFCCCCKNNCIRYDSGEVESQQFPFKDIDEQGMLAESDDNSRDGNIFDDGKGYSLSDD